MNFIPSRVILHLAAINLSVIFAASAAHAETFQRTILGDVTTFHLPRNMCDATNTGFGDNLLATLRDTSQRSKAVAKPILVFADCMSLKSSDRAAQPRIWGFFGYAQLPKQDPSEFNQKVFNDFLQTQQGKSELSKGMEIGETVTNESLKARGNSFSLGQTMPIPSDLSDQYGYITRMVSAIAVNKQKATLIIGVLSKVMEGKLILQTMYTRLTEDALTAEQMRDDMHAVAVRMHKQ